MVHTFPKSAQLSWGVYTENWIRTLLGGKYVPKKYTNLIWGVCSENWNWTLLGGTYVP